MSIGLIAGIIAFGWVFLCVFSGERERCFNTRKNEVEAALQAARVAQAAQASLDTAKN